MIRSSIFAACTLSLILTAGCEQASADQQKATNAQAEADGKIASAMKDANQKANNAQSEADTKIAGAKADFMKLREDYRHSTTTLLVELDQKMANLESKAKLASGAAKTDLEAKLVQIRAKRDSFATDYKRLDEAAAATWDDAKVQLDQAFTALNKLVDDA